MAARGGNALGGLHARRQRGGAPRPAARLRHPRAARRAGRRLRHGDHLLRHRGDSRGGRGGRDRDDPDLHLVRHLAARSGDRDDGLPRRQLLATAGDRHLHAAPHPALRPARARRRGGSESDGRRRRRRGREGAGGPSRMRVLMAGQTYGPRNGPGVFTARLAHGLAAAGHAVLVAVPAARPRSSRERDGGVELALVRSVSLAPVYPEVRTSFASAPALRALIEAWRPDVVHLHDHYPLAAAALAAARRRGLPVLGTDNFLPGNSLPHLTLLARHRATRRLLERYLWRSVRRVLGRVDLLTAATPTAVAALRPHLPDVPLEAVSCGVDLERFRPHAASDPAAVRRRHGLDPEAVLFLYVGRLDREKRLTTLIDAWTRLDGAAAAAQLALVGRGTEGAALARRITALGLEGSVRCLGFVADGDLPPLLAAADAFAMPSDVELQSIATLEAMACGLPVAAAAAAALPELVESGANGELFAPGNAADAARALALLLDHERRRRYRRESLRRAARHGLGRTVDRFAELYALLRRGDSAPQTAVA